MLYWHLVGGELYDYGEGFNQMLNPLAWWRETLHYALKGSADQYFFRVTSDRPLEEIWDDPGVQEILAAGRIAYRLGRFAAPIPPGSSGRETPAPACRSESIHESPTNRSGLRPRLSTAC